MIFVSEWRISLKNWVADEGELVIECSPRKVLHSLDCGIMAVWMAWKGHSKK